MEMIGLVVSVVAAVIGATWALRGSLGGIEGALREHVVKNAEEHKALEGRLVKLEGNRRRR